MNVDRLNNQIEFQEIFKYIEDTKNLKYNRLLDNPKNIFNMFCQFFKTYDIVLNKHILSVINISIDYIPSFETFFIFNEYNVFNIKIQCEIINSEHHFKYDFDLHSYFNLLTKYNGKLTPRNNIVELKITTV